MICPECEAEYREGITVCAHCEVPLVASLDEVPKVGGLSLVLETPNADELAILVEAIEAAAVPYVVEAGTALALLFGEELEDPTAPDFWQARVLVPEGFVAQVQPMLATLPSRQQRRS